MCAGRRLLVRQSGAPVLLAEVSPGWGGFRYARADTFRSALPPLRASEARRLGDGSGARPWHMRWAHRFVSLLERSTRSPLHRGRWALRVEPEDVVTDAARADAQWEPLLMSAPVGGVDWLRQGGSPVIALRRLSPPESARVKSWRRQARDGVLPPVLLWWVSSICGYVILDGHDRLQAALAERMWPAYLTLGMLPAADRAEPAIDHVISRYQRVMSDPRVDTAAAAAGRSASQVLKACLERPSTMSSSRAGPVPSRIPVRSMITVTYLSPRRV